jgi:hypothetical protein
MLQRLTDELCGDQPRAQLEARGSAIESAIDAAYDLLCSKRGNMSASEVVAFVRERVPGIDQARIRVELARRLRQRGAGW